MSKSKNLEGDIRVSRYRQEYHKHFLEKRAFLRGSRDTKGAGGYTSLNKSSERGRGQRHQLHQGVLPLSLSSPPGRTRALPNGAMRAYKFARVARPL